MRLTQSIATIIILFLSLISAPYALSDTCPPGEMTIDPHGGYYPDPILSSSPAIFRIVADGLVAGNFPHIVIVMTRTSLIGLWAPVRIEWTGGSTTIEPIRFQPALDGYVPPPSVTPYDSGRYPVQNLKERLGVNGTAVDTIYYAIAPFLASPVGSTAQQFIVTVPSASPRVIVLAVARTPCSSFFNMRVRPCTPGFIVPEPASIFMLVASISALGLFAVRRRKPAN